MADREVTADYVGSVRNAVTAIARLHRGERRLVFADSRTRVEEIAAGLRAAGVRTFVSHPSLSLHERRQGTPPSVASFLQRMDRTGRRSGTTRNRLFLATDDEELLACLALATLWREGTVEAVSAPPRPTHLFAQQVMALVLQQNGITRRDRPVARRSDARRAERGTR